MAGGQEKRLRPLTNRIPTPSAKVGVKPIIYLKIKWLGAKGVDRLVLLGSYREGKIVEYIKSVGCFDKFEFSMERVSLGAWVGI